MIEWLSFFTPSNVKAGLEIKDRLKKLNKSSPSEKTNSDTIAIENKEYTSKSGVRSYNQIALFYKETNNLNDTHITVDAHYVRPIVADLIRCSPNFIRIINFDLKEWYKQHLAGQSPLLNGVCDGIDKRYKNSNFNPLQLIQRTSIVMEATNITESEQIAALLELDFRHEKYPNVINVVSEKHIDRKRREYGADVKFFVEQLIFFQHRDDGNSYAFIAGSDALEEREFFAAVPRDSYIFGSLSEMCKEVHSDRKNIHGLKDFIESKNRRRTDIMVDVCKRKARYS